MGAVTMMTARRRSIIGKSAHEHYRAWQGFCTVIATVVGPVLGLLPSLWEYRHMQMGELCTASVVLRGSQESAGAAASVRGVWTDVLGTLWVAGEEKLVCTRGAPQCHRPLAAHRDFIT